MSILLNKFQRACGIWQRDGVPGLKRRMRHNLFSLREALNYQKWVRKTGAAADEDRKRITATIGDLRYTPLISVLLPVYNVDEKWLRLCIESVTKQIYTNWELCIADDRSTMPHVRRVLEDYAAADPRVKVVFRPENGHISAASNSAMELAAGEFAVLLDHDDELSQDAFFWVANEICDFPDTAMIYSDEDLIDERGRRFGPKFKPDFSRDLLYSLNLITHLSAYRTEILRDVGGFRLGFEGSQDYDLALRVIEQISENQIRHIPRILYHWRAIRGSVAFSMDEKPYAHERARDAIREHFQRSGTKATVEKSLYNLHRARYALPDPPPKISLFILENNSKTVSNAKLSFKEITDYKNIEVIDVATMNEPAAAINSAVARSGGEILCFIDGNLTPLSGDWLTEIASFAFHKQIGAVGLKILDTDHTMLGGGLILGGNNLVSNAYQGFPADEVGIMGRNGLTGNFSAVSASCMAVRRELFDLVGGFDSLKLPNKFYDADFCLKLRENGYRIVFTPFAKLMKIDPKVKLNLEKKPSAKEARYFSSKWPEPLKSDPFYNPNLSKRDGSFSIDI